MVVSEDEKIMKTRKRKTEILQAITYSLVSLAIASYLLQSGSYIFIPIAWSVFLSISLTPLSNWLETNRFPRVWAVTVSIVLVTCVVCIILYFFIGQAMGLLENTPTLEKKLKWYSGDIHAFLEKTFGMQIKRENISWNLSEIINGKNISSFLQYTAGAAILLGITPVYIFFFMYYKDFFSEFMNRFIAKTGIKPLNWINEANTMIQNYLAGMLIVTIIVALMSGVVFYLLGVEYYLFFALFIAVFNLIPYIGVILSSAVTVIYIFLITDSLWYPLLTLGLLWIIQLIENNLITPLIVGARVRLNPLAVILAIMIGSWIWGLSGIILFIPLLGILKIIFDKVDLLSPYGYLLGMDIPVNEKQENFLKMVKRKFAKQKLL